MIYTIPRQRYRDETVHHQSIVIPNSTNRHNKRAHHTTIDARHHYRNTCTVALSENAYSTTRTITFSLGIQGAVGYTTLCGACTSEHWFKMMFTATSKTCHPAQGCEGSPADAMDHLNMFFVSQNLTCVSIEIIGSSTKCVRQYTYVMDMTDFFLKLARIVFLRHLYSIKVTRSLIENLFYECSIIQEVLKDCQCEYVEEIVGFTCTSLCVKHIPTSTNYHQTNEKVER